MKNLVAALLFITLLKASAQELAVPVRLMANPKPLTEKFVGTDAFGWQYTVADNEFRKQKDKTTLKYKNVALGDIYRADLQNPLQIVLFYKKFNTVVLLDNQLNETLKINFSALPQGAPDLLVEAAGLASQNRLWLYDINTQQIGVFDPSKNTFKALTPPFNDGVQYYQNDYNYFYWIDTAGKCFAVNLFGSVTTLGQVPQFEGVFFLDGSNVLLHTAEGLCVYSLPLQTAKKVTVVEKTFESFYYKDQILSIFTNDQIIQYKINLP